MLSFRFYDVYGKQKKFLYEATLGDGDVVSSDITSYEDNEKRSIKGQTFEVNSGPDFSVRVHLTMNAKVFLFSLRVDAVYHKSLNSPTVYDHVDDDGDYYG